MGSLEKPDAAPVPDANKNECLPEFTDPEKHLSSLSNDVAKNKDVIRYDPKLFKTPLEYYRYVLTGIDSPDDIVEVLRNFVEYYDDPQDRMTPAEVVLAAGFGDCENYSWLAKKLLDNLGCKKGFNYQARVIGYRKHAICIYTDENGEKWVIDQNEKIKFTSLLEASPLFKKNPGDSEEDNLIEEGSLVNKGLRKKTRLDEQLTDNHEVVLFRFYDLDYDESFNPARHLPPEWSNYKQTQISFRNNFVVIYINGILYSAENEEKKETSFYDEAGAFKSKEIKDGDRRLVFKDGSTKVREINYMTGPVEAEFFDTDGCLYQKNYKEGEVHVELFYSDGKTKQRNFRNGIIETFEPGTGGLYLRRFPAGSTETEFYFPNGKVRQRNFREGNIHREFFNEDGSPDQRVFNKNKGVKFAKEWYDANGKIIQTESFDGKITTSPSPTP